MIEVDDLGTMQSGQKGLFVDWVEPRDVAGGSRLGAEGLVLGVHENEGDVGGPSRDVRLPNTVAQQDGSLLLAAGGQI